MYSHKDYLGEFIDLPAGKVVCIGRNYVDHINELNNPIPQQPILFIKPSTAICDASQPLSIPIDQGQCHNELEIAVLVQHTLCQAAPSEVLNGVWGYGLGLDLTLRDVQTQLKKDGLPWERAKAFDRSCPLSGFVPRSSIEDQHAITFKLIVNDGVRQQGNSQMMITDIIRLLVEISHTFTLLPGDVVMTGTPKGVGPLCIGDRLEMSMERYIHLKTTVV
jgi:2-keto-4-pentenoate hydratase/2-oxohepta-3-ene-1,7-dioic acid hydratase in catechol pathway